MTRLVHKPTGANIIEILEYDGELAHVKADQADFPIIPSSKGGKNFPLYYTNRRWVSKSELIFVGDWEQDVMFMGGPDLDADDLAEWPGELPAVQ